MTIYYTIRKETPGGETMATNEIRKLAHQMIDELEKEELSVVIKNMANLKKKGNGKDNKRIPFDKNNDHSIK